MKRIIVAICLALGFLLLSSCGKDDDQYYSYSVVIEDGFATKHPNAVLYLCEYNHSREYVGTRAWVNVTSGVRKDVVVSLDDPTEYVKIQYTENLAEEHWVRVVYKLEKGRNVVITLNDKTQTTDTEPQIP